MNAVTFNINDQADCLAIISSPLIALAPHKQTIFYYNYVVHASRYIIQPLEAPPTVQNHSAHRNSKPKNVYDTLRIA